jgi:hypothetical protein
LPKKYESPSCEFTDHEKWRAEQVEAWRNETKRLRDDTVTKKPGDHFNENEYQAWADSHVGTDGPERTHTDAGIEGPERAHAAQNAQTRSAPADSTFTKYIKEEFSTGAVRENDEGKGFFSFIPPNALRSLARRFEDGAKKYSDHNWQNGMPLSRYYDAIMRHSLAALEGQSDEDHLGAVMWNAAAWAWTEEKIASGKLPKKLDDITYRSDGR